MSEHPLSPTRRSFVFGISAMAGMASKRSLCMVDHKKTPIHEKTSVYHVQSTAKELKSGFPYFSYHDSVSKMWAKKWRPPCEMAIYPFPDSKLSDFEPIFSDLVKISGDSSTILLKPDEYAAPFFPVAEKLVESAARAEAEQNIVEARDLYLRGAAVYRISRFPLNRSSLSQRAWELGKAAYVKGGVYLDPPILPIRIPFVHADVSKSDSNIAIEAYMRIPKGARPERGWPLVLFICGLDAYKTDQTPRTQEHVNRGFATLTFEIPGTGDCPAAPNDPKSPDRLMGSILDWVESSKLEYGFNLEKVVARGISTGGYYAFRVAHTHANRLFAVVAQGGGCHHMFEPDWIHAQSQMEYPFALAEALAYKFGYRGNAPLDNYVSEAKKFSLLEAGTLDLPNCKVLVIDGMEDSIFPIEDNFIFAKKGMNKDLIALGGRGHMGNPGAEDILYSWIDQALTEKE